MQVEWNGHQVLDEVHRRISAEMHQDAQAVVAIAQSLAPKHTGALALGLSYDWNDADLTVVFTAREPYSIFQEYGTRYIPPHPYLRPAINQVFSRKYGVNTEMDFANVPHIANPLLADAGGFHLPHGVLGRAQRRHIHQHLIPTSERYYVGAVSRTKMSVRKHY